MADHILDLQSVNKAYGNALAVRDVSLRVREGEFLTFLGPSGSGKTTTLMMIAGLQMPSGGQILLRGEPVESLPPYRRNIGMVFQHYALFPHMTAAENIAFPLQMRKLDRGSIRKQVRDALSLVGLSDLGGRYPAQMSGGQQQRVALARATVYRPSLLLMDEPLGALDKKLREQMQGEIMALHRNLGITVLYVTHDQEEALVMSDRIAIFSQGVIEQVGAPAELYENPRSAFVANFIGETNFIPAIVCAKSQVSVEVETPVGRLSVPAQSADLGSRMNLAVRPERIQMSRVRVHGHPCVRGTVDARVYLGQSQRYTIALPGGLSVSVLQPPGLDESFSPSPGSEVYVSWEADHSRLLQGTAWDSQGGHARTM